MCSRLSSHQVGLLCAVVGITVYLNSLDCGFCFDDVSAIKDNADLRSGSPWSNLIWNDFWGTPMHLEGSHKSYRPLCVLTFRINYLLHGLQPFGYHAGNVLLHGLVCCVFVLLCSDVVFQHYRSRTVPTLVAGLSFAVHPIHTEAVAGVVGRAECLSALFFLLSFLAYRRSIDGQQNRGGAVSWFVLSLFLCVCSVLSKEQGVTVITLCLCYDFFIVHRNDLKSSLSLLRSLFSCQPKPSWWNSFLCRVAAMVVFFVMVMSVRVKIMHDRLPVFTVHDNPAVSLATPYRQLHWMYLIFVNCWLLLNPSALCADWTMGTVPLIQTLADPRNMLTLATFIVFAVIVYYSVSGFSVEQQAVLFALVLMVFPFLPASNLFFPVGFVVAERILYVPSMGFSILLAVGAHRMLRGHMRGLATFSITCLLICHTIKTLERNRDWYSDLALFTSAVHTNPHNGKIYNNLGHVYEHEKNFLLAEAMFRSAAAKQSDDVGAYINLGRVLKAQMKYSDAEEAYMKAVDLIPKEKTFRIAPGHINVFYNLANLVKVNSSRLNEALLLYNRALSMKPEFVEAHMNKADTLLKLNRTDQALSSYQTAVKYGPGNPDAHYNLGTVYLNKGDVANAQKCYQRVLSLNGKHTLAMFNMGLLLTEQKTQDGLRQAINMFQQLIHLEPKNDKAYFQLAMAYIELGDLEHGKQSLEQVLAINPRYRSALYNLAMLLYQERQYQRVLNLLTVLRQHHPDHVGGMQLLGDTLTQLKRYKEAKEAYQLSLRHNPNHVTALHNLGVVMAELGDFAGALKHFARTLELDPHHKTAHRHMQGAQKMLEKKQNQ